MKFRYIDSKSNNLPEKIVTAKDIPLLQQSVVKTGTSSSQYPGQYDLFYFTSAAITRDIYLFENAIGKLNLTCYSHRLNFFIYMKIHLNSVRTYTDSQENLYWPFFIEKGATIHVSSDDVEIMRNFLKDLETYADVLDPKSGATELQAVEVLSSIKVVFPRYKASITHYMQSQEKISNSILFESWNPSDISKITSTIINKEKRDAKSEGTQFDLKFSWMLSSDKDESHQAEFLAFCPFTIQCRYKTFWKSDFEKNYSQMLPSIFDENVHMDAPPEGCNCILM